VDLNEEAIQICQLSLWIKTAARGKQLTSLDHTIREGNSVNPGETVNYRSRLNTKINRNFEVFTPTGFLAANTQHISDKGAQMVRYYGWYNNKMRGVRQRKLSLELKLRRPGVSPPPPLILPSKRWRDLIFQVWHVDPLRCPACQNPMRVTTQPVGRITASRPNSTECLEAPRG
jgi:hypothetical protein